LLKVFYSPRQSVAQNASFSPSAGKPERVVEQWRRRCPIDVVEPEPVTVQELCLAHDAEFVRDVLACRQRNGFGNLSRAVADSLPYTTGSLVSATRHVFAHGGAACSPRAGSITPDSRAPRRLANAPMPNWISWVTSVSSFAGLPSAEPSVTEYVPTPPV
jgi:hypothetical protein